MDHLSEDGQPCTRHAPSLDVLLGLATIGARASGFQHDAASKLQSLVMALEEIGERADALRDRELTVALEAGRAAAEELTALLQGFRALSRRPPASPTPIRELFERASHRTKIQVRGALPATPVTVSAHEIVHILSLLLDGAVGRATPREVTVVADATSVALPAGSSAEVIAVAAYVMRRAGGELRCTADRVRLIWPASAPVTP